MMRSHAARALGAVAISGARTALAPTARGQHQLVVPGSEPNIKYGWRNLLALSALVGEHDALVLLDTFWSWVGDIRAGQDMSPLAMKLDTLEGTGRHAVRILRQLSGTQRRQVMFLLNRALLVPERGESALRFTIVSSRKMVRLSIGMAARRR
ncbi:MAG TPA: hypothetical protein VLF59_03510 [Candidatus Saccharimonadales bacterium]|nr:hypothetical protein [Candidatus Saccharimonadales bacterium]